MAASHVQNMQKALDQMNVQLHQVISDLTGLTGLTIIKAILVGERNPQVLAKLRDRRIKANEQTIAKSLIGDYRREHLFTLRQSLESFRHYQKLISACDTEIEQYLEAFESKDSKLNPPAATPASPEEQKLQGSEPRFDLKSHLHRIFGVDLNQ
jgi:transposase